jgi:hypothetical protein
VAVSNGRSRRGEDGDGEVEGKCVGVRPSGTEEARQRHAGAETEEEERRDGSEGGGRPPGVGGWRVRQGERRRQHRGWWGGAPAVVRLDWQRGNNNNGSGCGCGWGTEIRCHSRCH